MFVTHEEGQGLVEYAMIIALIAFVLIAALSYLSVAIESTFNMVGASLST